ncbi:MAG: hypothetical protein AB7F22_29305 [Reyranella sp.]|uniref:hypothetical protein n=1 Tax=Reyranella sp. TaxID=1929291 RepID=UPI003D13044A
MFNRLPLACLATLFVWTGAASAQTFDMKGTWTGTSKSIVSGLAGYHPGTVAAKPAGGNRLTELPFTTRIEGQDGNRVWGTLSSAAAVDAVIGVISPDGKQLRLVLKGRGIIDGTIVDPDTIDIFYTEDRNGVAVAATNTWKRQK